ncbi:MAG: hypothetical protein NZL91_03315 [Thermoflexales bacterium]|nr:hypothetical protein [Thermoflexales bacterium]
MNTILVVSHDRIGGRMAGVGIRYYEVARALAGHGLQVTLVAPFGSELPRTASPHLENLRFDTFVTFEDEKLVALARKHTCFFAYPDVIWRCRRWIDELDTYVIVDGYDITLFEQLELHAASHQPIGELVQNHLTSLRYVLQRGDFFVTATERQRDFWLGLLTAAGRIDEELYRGDASLRALVDLLPYGVPDEPPMHTRKVLRGVVAGIDEADFIVLWGGGAWQWLDPLTLVRAAALIAQTRSDVKFFFPGVSHPSPDLVGAMPIQQELIALSEQLGLLNKVVFFGKWAEYEDWQNFLVESDCGVSLHRDHLEARFAARTRIMSYLWANLPMVLTEGDELAEQLSGLGLARLVPQSNAEAVASAILELAQAKKRTRIDASALKKQFSWKAVTRAFADRCKAACNMKRKHKRQEFHRSTMHGLPPSLRMPQPSTPIAKILYPVLRALMLWYVEALLDQQHQINTSLLARLAEQESRLAEQESRLAEQESRLAEQESRLAEQESRLATQSSVLREAELLMTDLIEQTTLAAME